MSQQDNNQPRSVLSLNEKVLYLLVALTAISTVASALWNPGGWDDEWMSGWLRNFSTQMIGAFAVFILIQAMFGRGLRQGADQRSRDDLKRTLLRELRSGDHPLTLAAVARLAEEGWLEDGTLQGANLKRANLHGVNLMDARLQEAILKEADMQAANLENARLQGADLEEANLLGANLEAANLTGANLEGAFLRNANLEETNFERANLEEADLEDANLEDAVLRGADLEEANLKNANFDDARFDGHTRLPDGSMWTPDIDMVRFTDPDHPDFWQPDA